MKYVLSASLNSFLLYITIMETTLTKGVGISNF